MSFEEVRLLRERARAFLKYAEEALSDGEYDFSCFASEQAAQLFTKSVMLELIGEIPRLHRLRDILSLLGSSIPEAEGVVSGFVEENRERLRSLDEAYITSRYLPFKYEREDAETLLNVSKEVIRLGEGILGECRR